MGRWWYILLLLPLGYVQAWPLSVVSYNVENFFDAHHDSLRNDSAFLPEGTYHWTSSRFYLKAEQIARALVNATDDSPALIGLQEVENDHCLDVLCRYLRSYRYIHYESSDRRGIDVALLYDPEQVDILSSAALPVPEVHTRDILYVSARTLRGDTLHLFVCHLPSRRSGARLSEPLRRSARVVVQHHVDSLLAQSAEARIIVMGDMNGSPHNDLRGLTNKMVSLERKGYGSYRYRGIWTCLDQFYVSPALNAISSVRIADVPLLLEEDPHYLDSRPRRTLRGFHYDRGGFSDHLPIVLTLP